jgi:hypothetical protein
MHREDQRPEEGAETPGGRAALPHPLGLSQETEEDEVEGESDEGVEEEAGEMVAGRVHAPDQIVEAEGHPRERYEAAQIHRGEHPSEVGQAEATV